MKYILPGAPAQPQDGPRSTALAAERIISETVQHLKARGATRFALRAHMDSPAAVAFWRHVGFDPILYVTIKELE